ncbi:MAG: hypothetical protein OEL57_10125 [Trichlorobacter sp.]|uniref:hypothetical protein n=1 Tax=Trichlorobacter sp. TaxID=2911007 RepID=UPI0025634CC4|nr:hypothetical protein [Trichlorobacter sp.]MDK9718243.1 hypothetical protein [Trichlorobacter sp.]
MSAGQDSLLFFDYIPFETSSLDGYRIRFHLYTMTGPVVNPGTWKMTLKGVDGIVFVTHGGGEAVEDAGDSFQLLKAMLGSYGRSLHGLPKVWLASDAADGRGRSELADCFDSSRTVICSQHTGEGVLQALALLSQEVLHELRNQYEPASEAAVQDVPAESLTNVSLDQSARPHNVITLPELKISLAGSSSFIIPLTIQGGETIKRCNLRFSVQLEEELL